MPLFQEFDLTTYAGGRIEAVTPGSVAAVTGLLPGDELLAINDHPVGDVIDVQYYGAEESLDLLVRRGREHLLFEAERDYNQPLGLTFVHPTFDTDIRRCNNLCEFCFVLQMAPRFRRTLYIKDDDYRYSFLFGHYVTLTNLTDHDWWRIETMRLTPLYVSVHATDLELRRRFLRNEQAPDIMEQLHWLAERNIQVHTQLVIVPEFNDGVHLERSLQDLAQLRPCVQSVSVVPVGLTKQHKYDLRPHTGAEALATLSFVEARQRSFLSQSGSRFVFATDEWYLVAGRTVPELAAYEGHQLEENGLGMVRRFLDEWRAVQLEIGRAQAENSRNWIRTQKGVVTLVTGTLFEPILSEAVLEFAALTSLDTRVTVIENRCLGPTITAAGLLMGEDVLDQLEAPAADDLIVLPRVMFDHPDTISLDDLSPQHLADRLGCAVALADTMGDVWDAITGRSRVIFHPHGEVKDPGQQTHV